MVRCRSLDDVGLIILLNVMGCFLGKLLGEEDEEDGGGSD